MKKKFLSVVAAFCIGYWHQTDAEAVSIVVPKQCLVEKASLVLYMLDDLGQPCVGTCRLSETFEQKTILQKDLQIQFQDCIDKVSNSIDVTHTSKPKEHEVLLHIEFQEDMKVMRVLIVKDTLLADNPFDVLSIPVNNVDMPTIQEEDEFDHLSDLVVDIDPVKIKKSAMKYQPQSLHQYALYAKIYVMMQYKYVKRKFQNLAQWLNIKK
ncbi:MAG: hypothetical protein CL947_01580 [Epsilonproteobacteria bacterium]|nr:hypothetical protein [Campylobacterota bacterium]|tara:strand:+ start:1297 stop:1926 length:630 start_codon:yes stop_codon:yes gene_type:complete